MITSCASHLYCASYDYLIVYPRDKDVEANVRGLVSMEMDIKGLTCVSMKRMIIVESSMGSLKVLMRNFLVSMTER
jgi:hypothetical protein